MPGVQEAVIPQEQEPLLKKQDTWVQKDEYTGEASAKKEDELEKNAENMTKTEESTPLASSMVTLKEAPGGFTTVKEKFMEKFFENQQVKKVVERVSETWSEHVEPKAGPYIDWIKKKKANYPDLEANLLAIVVILYGGCFSNLVVLYAAFTLTGSMAVVKKVNEFASGFNGDRGIKNGLFALLRSTTPSNVNLLFYKVCVQICVMKLMFGWLPAFTLCIGCSVGAFVLSSFKHELEGALKKKAFLPSDLSNNNWAPFCIKYVICWILSLCAAVAPTFFTSLLAAFYGIDMLKELKDVSGPVRFGIAVFAAIWQCYCSYGMSTFTYVILSPVCIVNSFF